MIEYGKINSLRVGKIDGSNIVLDGGELGDISIPRKEVPVRLDVNDYADAFIYVDSKDRVIASPRKPYAQAGQFALLNVVESNSYGAFLDWGLEQDLRVPVKEQQKKLRQGQSCIVYVYNDKNNHTTASSRLNKFLKNIPVKFREGQRVDLVIGDITPMGYKAIINQTHLGILYRNEVFRILEKGQSVKGFIKKIREDGRIDLLLQKRSPMTADDLPGKIMDALKEHGGSLDISDKTTPERIYSLFGVSKKRYKDAIGGLYKRRLIIVDDYAIRLAPGRVNRPPDTQSGREGRGNRKMRQKKKIKR